MSDTDHPDQDDEVTLKRLNKEWLGKIVRQREAPEGHECNIGLTFHVGEIALFGPTSRPWVRQSHGHWTPLDHVERVATVAFRGDPDLGNVVLLTAGGMKPQRIYLNRTDQTVAELLEQLQKAAEWLTQAEMLKRNIEVQVEGE